MRLVVHIRASGVLESDAADGELVLAIGDSDPTLMSLQLGSDFGSHPPSLSDSLGVAVNKLAPTFG